MNALLVYPKFPPSIWNLQHTISSTSAKALYYPLGLLTVAALLPKEWSIKLIDCNVDDISENGWDWSDIILISCTLAQRSEVWLLLKEAQKRGKKTVVGGPYATLLPEELIEHGCDYVFCGEAENSIDQLFNVIEQESDQRIIKNTSYSKITTSPTPRFDLIDLDNCYSSTIQTTRGCPFKCEFCDVYALTGSTPRFKTPDQVIAELETLFQQGARGLVFFADDNFIGVRKNAKAICKRITQWNRSYGEPFNFAAQVSINLGQDLEMIDLMTAANFGDVFIGIESPEESLLAQSQKYQNVANPLLESVANIKENGLSVIGSFIIGFDNEKKGAGKRICDFVEKAAIPIIMPNMLGAIPKTKLWYRLAQEKRLLTDGADTSKDLTLLLIPNFIPTRPIMEILDEFIGMWEYLYHPPRYLGRAYRYYLGVRPTRKAMAFSTGETAQEHRVKPAKIPIKKKFGEIKVFLRYLIVSGIDSPYRLQFWKQFFGVLKHNPSRFTQYIISCILGQELHLVSKSIKKLYEQDRNKIALQKHKP